MTPEISTTGTAELITLIKAVIGLLSEYPLNIYVLGSFFLMGITLFKRTKGAVKQ